MNIAPLQNQPYIIPKKNVNKEKNMARSNISFGKNPTITLSSMRNNLSNILNSSFKIHTKLASTPICKSSDNTGYLVERREQMGINLDNYNKIINHIVDNASSYTFDIPLVGVSWQSPFIQDIIKNGESSPFTNFFKGANSHTKIDILPLNRESIKVKVINRKFDPRDKKKIDKNYDKNKPTYIQLYDKQYTKEINSPITKYDDPTTQKKLFTPQYFIVDPNEEVLLNDDTSLTNILQKGSIAFRNSTIGSEGQLSHWNGCNNIITYDYTNPKVQDLSNRTAQFWARKFSKDSLATLVKKLEELSDKTTNKEKYDCINTALPYTKDGKLAKILQDEDKLNAYKLGNLNTGISTDEFLEREILDFNLSTLPVDNDLYALFSSEQLTQLAENTSDLKLSKWEIEKNSNNDNIKKRNDFYKNKISPFIKNVLIKLEKKLEKSDDQKIFKDQDITEFGRFVVDTYRDDIVEFALLKTLQPKLKNGSDIIKNSEFNFDIDEVKNLNCSSLGLGGYYHYKDKASNLISHMNNFHFSEKDASQVAEVLKQKIGKATLQTFEIANVIQRTYSIGADFRLDAAKDIAAISKVNDSEISCKEFYSSLTKIYKNMFDKIIYENPEANIMGEFTDLPGTEQQQINFKNEMIKIGMTGINNYDYTFSPITETLITKETTFKIFIERMRDYIKDIPKENIINSNNFLDNHDKPRIMHLAAVDIEYFNNTKPQSTLEKAKKTLGKKDLKFTDLNEYDTKSLAVADKMINALNKIDKNILQQEQKNSIKKEIIKRTKDSHLGTEPIENSLEDIFKTIQLDSGTKDKIMESMLNTILEPATKKVLASYKLLSVLPGQPNLFQGTFEGATGYESISGNKFEGNRREVSTYLGKLDCIKTYTEALKQIITDIRKEDNIQTRQHTFNNGTENYILPKNNIFGLIRKDEDNIVIALSNGNTTEATLGNEIDLSTIEDENIKDDDQKKLLDLFNNIDKKETLFYDNEEKEYYIQKDDKSNNYILKCKDNGEIKITEQDYGTLILTSKKPSTPTPTPTPTPSDEYLNSLFEQAKAFSIKIDSNTKDNNGKAKPSDSKSNIFSILGLTLGLASSLGLLGIGTYFLMRPKNNNKDVQKQEKTLGIG